MPDTPELRAEVAGVVAVCERVGEAADTRCAIWHVGVHPSDTVPRLRGAWVVEDDDAIATLLRKRTVWALSTGAEELARAHASGILDPAATDAAVQAAITAWDAAFAAEVERSGRALKRPDWGITAQLGVGGERPDSDDSDEAQPVSGVADGAEPEIVAALTAARRLEALARQWSTAQTRRLTRKFLRAEELGGDTAAPLPLST